MVATLIDSSTDVETLITRVAAGEPAAYELLYGRIVPQVIAIAQRVVRDRAIAEEVAQEVLLEVWRKAGDFDAGRGSWRGWIATLAHRRAVDRVRSEQARRDRVERVARREVTTPVDHVAEEVGVALEHDLVRGALAVLSDRQREAIELAYFHGHTYREVATRLGIPEGTAKSRLRDGLLRLRASLDGMV